jgi:xanthine dehydrogenase accessory factor
MKSISNKESLREPPFGGQGGFWEFINDKLTVNINVMLLWVLESEGSSPGRKGFKMAVSADGDLYGTIGGGIMEHKLVERARSLLVTNSKEISIVKQFHDKTHNKNQSGMICSGSQLNALIPLNLSDARKNIRTIAEASLNNKNKIIHLSPAGIKISDEPASGFDYKTETEWTYTEPLNQKPVIHIIGGGHVGLALSELMHFLGFYIKLYDDRPELNTITQNSFADETCITDYNSISETINISEIDFAVIMTIGYRTDKIVLKQLLDKDFFYLGLLGSEKKTQALFNELKEEGIDENKLSRLFAPIGLNIFSKTTKEIAVSVAAQIILEKNKNLPTGRNKKSS